MQRPPTQWGNAIMLKFFTVLCLLIHCHAKSILSHKRSRNGSMSNYLLISKNNTHAKSIFSHKRSRNGSMSNYLLISKNNTENAVKREWETGGHYHRAVPEHFQMSEHGPEIHLDIDECGSRVDTHPAGLSVDTSTDPHEHCCHHCHHECDCCCCDDCCGKRSFVKDEQHNVDDDHRDPGAHLIQHTPDTGELRGNGDESCMDVGEGGCPNTGDTEQCYGGVCRDHVAHYANIQPHRLFQYSEHAVRKPLHSVYDIPNTPGIDNYHPIPHLLAESQNNNEHQNSEHKDGFRHSTYDSDTGHIAGQTRGKIGTDTPMEGRVSDGNDLSSYADESPPKLVTFGRNNEGIALNDEVTNHNPAGTRDITQEAIALKRSSVKSLKRSKRC